MLVGNRSLGFSCGIPTIRLLNVDTAVLETELELRAVCAPYSDSPLDEDMPWSYKTAGELECVETLPVLEVETLAETADWTVPDEVVVEGQLLATVVAVV